MAVSKSDSYVTVKNGLFYLEGKRYTFMGANYWQGMNLGASCCCGDRKRLLRELDFMKSKGIVNLRVLAATEADLHLQFAAQPALQTSPGVYNEDLFNGLDFLLHEMGKRNMKAVMVLGNFWSWSGGFAQYLKWCGQDEIPVPQLAKISWDEFANFSKQFYTNPCAQELMNNHIRKVVNRVNSLSGVKYSSDPAIMSWQLANEPRGYDMTEHFGNWISNTAALIKQLDKNHLVSIGTEGNTATSLSGLDVFSNNNYPDIDYITMHIWLQNWGWFIPGQEESVYLDAIKKADHYWDVHATAARQLNKPIVLEEFGLARDNEEYAPKTPVTWRDRYLLHIFEKTLHSIANGQSVQGLNVWTFSGEGRPKRPGEFWQKGDPLTGDPPHELQGWYGIYDSDTSTIRLIEKYANRFCQLKSGLIINRE